MSEIKPVVAEKLDCGNRDQSLFTTTFEKIRSIRRLIQAFENAF